MALAALAASADFPACLVFQVSLDFLVAGSVGFLALAVVVLAGSLVAAFQVFLADLVFQGLASLGLVVQVFPDLAVSQGGQVLAVQASLVSLAGLDLAVTRAFLAQRRPQSQYPPAPRQQRT